MGHYASEMYPRSDEEMAWREARRLEVEENREALDAFWDRSGSCPLCGASVEWDWGDARNAILHMKFHADIGHQPTVQDHADGSRDA